MSETLKDRVALVTGASSGIGRAVAQTLSAAGAAVVCADLQASSLAGGYEEDIDTDTVDLIQGNGGRACFVETDVRDSESVKRAVAAAVDTYGRLDILVNSAGVVRQEGLFDCTDENYDLQMDVNVKGTWLCCKHAIEQMLAQDPLSDESRGRIINLSSVAGMVGLPNSTVYAQSKAAVIGLTRALAIEFGKQKITVNAIAPGLIPTAMSRQGIEDPVMLENLVQATPVGRAGASSDIARTVLFFAADECGFISGQTVPVDGGMTAQ